MSVYTAGEIVAWMLLAALLGGVLGWLLRTIAYERAARRARRAERTAAPATAETVDDAPDEPATLPSEPVTSEPVASDVDEGPYPGSALPGPDGSAPTAEHVVKAKKASRIYHLPSSPFYARTTADVWFVDEDAAAAAGFRPPGRKAADT